jgi:hypothetical protein
MTILGRICNTRHSNVRNYLQEQSIKVIGHPPYSPDLASCDFSLSSYIKESLGTCKNDKGSITIIISRIIIISTERSGQKLLTNG